MLFSWPVKNVHVQKYGNKNLKNTTLCKTLNTFDPQAAARSPKRKSQSTPSIPTMSWRGSLLARVKIEHNSLGSYLFDPMLNGIKRVYCFR